MPTNTFFRLPKEKQESLKQAAIKEFSSVSYIEASINRIIKTAHIPRGSFYMYFENKEDLYQYLIEDIHKDAREKFLSCLEKQNGNIFETIMEFFGYFTDYMHHHNRELFEKIWLNMNYKRTHDWAYQPSLCEGQPFPFIVPKINKENLNMKEDSDLYYILELLFAAFIRELCLVFFHHIEIEEAKKQLEKHITLIKEGLERKKI